MNSKVQIIKHIEACINVNLGKINEEMIHILFTELKSSHDEVCLLLHDICKLYFSDENDPHWNYVLINLYLLNSLINILKNDSNEMLSVQDYKHLKECIKKVADVGIYSKLEKSLPFYKESAHVTDDIFLNYNILKCTTYALYKLSKNADLRITVIQESLRAILVALYQIIFCPLKKPLPDVESKMTLDMYNRLIEEREIFRNIFNDLKKNIFPVIYVKETMLIHQEKSPMWLKKALSQTLTNIILREDGVQTIIKAIVVDSTNDDTKNWKPILIIVKLLMACKSKEEFKGNIIKQVIKLVNRDDIEENLIYERIFVEFTKELYNNNREICNETLLEYILRIFNFLTNKEYTYEQNMDLTMNIKQSIRLLNGTFIQNNTEFNCLPTELIAKYSSIFLYIYYFLKRSKHKKAVTDFKSIILKCLSSSKEHFFKTMDSFVCNICSNEILKIRDSLKIDLNENDEFFIENSEHCLVLPISESLESVQNIIDNSSDLLIHLFGYLLNCVSNNEIYFKKSNDDLINIEEEYVSNYFEKKIAVYKCLSELSENKKLQKKLVETPEDIILYLKNIFQRSIDLKHHKECDTENFQLIFTAVMILQSLLKNCDRQNVSKYAILDSLLNTIVNETSNNELKQLINDILNILNNKSHIKKCKTPNNRSILDIALEDICDPLLPVRGHALMTLTKLIEAKDKEALDRRQYIFNIFQQNLKQEDSFLYLSAINGLAAMANIRPDSVIEILCEEYSDIDKKNMENGHEVRTKLGEVLIKTSKDLGEMIPKYKSILLNTFLNGTKDDDYLIRASALSNLGEICKLLGYKLGSVITEILVCVHSIIATDKSVEVRRAAVLVLRQIFVGCDKDIIAFLKEDILPIYRELKFIYYNDADDVMRLQAQVALEELNERMKDFLFPAPTLSLNKKSIVMS